MIKSTSQFQAIDAWLKNWADFYNNEENENT